jgi:drug/metabolite transporter (DMT)-like permease
LGVLASIWALKYIEATISSTVINAKGFLVMLIAYFYLSIVPRPYQIIGGILTVAGVTLLSYGQHRRNKRLLELEQKLLDK